MKVIIAIILIIALTIRIAYKNVKQDYMYCDDDCYMCHEKHWCKKSEAKLR